MTLAQTHTTTIRVYKLETIIAGFRVLFTNLIYIFSVYTLDLSGLLTMAVVVKVCMSTIISDFSVSEFYRLMKST